MIQSSNINVFRKYDSIVPQSILMLVQFFANADLGNCYKRGIRSEMDASPLMPDVLDLENREGCTLIIYHP
jgi:hypothetical protein